MTKHEKSLLVATVLLALSICSYQAGAQGFQNLDFESATIVPIPGDPYGRVQFAQAFPGWTSSVGGGQQSAALHNATFQDSSGVAILDSGWTEARSEARGSLIAGDFTALLMAGVTGVNNTPADTAIFQTGLVPAGTESLRLKANINFAGTFDFFRVTLGGQPLSLVPLQTTTNFTLYSADIHSWA